MQTFKLSCIDFQNVIRYNRNFIPKKHIFQFQSEPCEANKCNGHGKCTLNIDGDAICECPRNYTGKYCQFLMRKSVLLTQIDRVHSIISSRE